MEFDSSTEAFTLEVRPGKQLTKQRLEEIVVARGAEAEMTYSVRWEVGAELVVQTSDRGQPFVAPLLGGGTYDFSTVLGVRPVVLTFWASWCKPCLVEAPHLVALHTKYPGVEFTAVSIDEANDHDKLRVVVGDLHVTYPVPLDPSGKVLAIYAQGASIPLTFVIDASGKVVYRHQNFHDGDEKPLEEAIRAVVEAQDNKDK